MIPVRIHAMIFLSILLSFLLHFITASDPLPKNPGSSAIYVYFIYYTFK